MIATAKMYLKNAETTFKNAEMRVCTELWPLRCPWPFWEALRTEYTNAACCVGHLRVLRLPSPRAAFAIAPRDVY